MRPMRYTSWGSLWLNSLDLSISSTIQIQYNTIQSEEDRLVCCIFVVRVIHVEIDMSLDNETQPSFGPPLAGGVGPGGLTVTNLTEPRQVMASSTLKCIRCDCRTAPWEATRL